MRLTITEGETMGTKEAMAAQLIRDEWREGLGMLADALTDVAAALLTQAAVAGGPQGTPAFGAAVSTFEHIRKHITEAADDANETETD